MEKSEKFEYEDEQNDYDKSHEIEVADTTAEKMLKLNKVEELRVKDFARAHVINLEQPCKRQDLQSMVGCIEAFQGMVGRTVMKLNICTPMHRKHIGLSQHYAVMEECIAIFGG